MKYIVHVERTLTQSGYMEVDAEDDEEARDWGHEGLLENAVVRWGYLVSQGGKVLEVKPCSPKQEN